MPKAKREAAAGRGPSPLRVPPKGSYLDHCLQALLGSAEEMRRSTPSLSREERRAAAWFIQLAEPRRPWLWPIWAYRDLIVRPRFSEIMGEAAADRLFEDSPEIPLMHAALEMDVRKRRAKKEAKQNPQPDYRDLTRIIVGAAYQDHVWRTRGAGSPNDRHAAVADRLGLGDLGVIRRWERGYFAKQASDDELALYVHFARDLDRLAAIGRVRSRDPNSSGFAEAPA
ncbi:hypothetical protein [Paracoccus sp. 22332]|uniref:hypothetical protein n=1 Tax=Paracoccus sp. 22332 TaxID=3453913 RepID=UPI003F83A429